MRACGDVTVTLDTLVALAGSRDLPRDTSSGSDGATSFSNVRSVVEPLSSVIACSRSSSKQQEQPQGLPQQHHSLAHALLFLIETHIKQLIRAAITARHSRDAPQSGQTTAAGAGS
jgi:hypothetical protein